jgi:chromosomal replication initiation ATPase DnaA
MNHNLQIFKEKILQENLSKTETYWIDQIDFQIVDNDLNLCVNSEFVKTSIEKKVFDKILNVSKSISEIDNCIFILDPSKKVKKTELSSPFG